LRPLLFDTSVWVEQLRTRALDPLFPSMRGKYLLELDAVVAAELIGGCRSKRERRVIDALRSPFERAGRLHCPERSDFVRASTALSRLRERGRSLSNPGAALLDGLIVSIACRQGALLVTCNVRDFSMLSEALPATIESFSDFSTRLGRD
jgi:predicted nucleic acid-binding protein